jgi:hypothetical protein
LLVVAAGLVAGSFAHVDGLHSQRFGPEQEVTSGCSASHPARFEPLLAKRTVDCPACLVQLQQHAAAPDVAVVAAASTVGGAIGPFRQSRLGRGAHRLAAPRGPPAA